MARLQIHPVNALKDNYVYLLVDGAEGTAVAVDPGEAPPVEAALARLGVTLKQIWCTHHHADHTGANAELAARHGVTEVYGSPYDQEHGRVPAQTRALADGEEFSWAGEKVTALHIPGHTLGHVAFLVAGNVFPGDTLFGACCGRMFEGTPVQMQGSLARLRTLPDDTKVWCGHEYTLGCLKFAVTVDPDNAALAARLARVAAAPDERTIPLSLAEEKATNPMLRWDAPALQQLAGTTDPVEVFAFARRTKDSWRG